MDGDSARIILYFIVIVHARNDVFVGWWLTCPTTRQLADDHPQLKEVFLAFNEMRLARIRLKTISLTAMTDRQATEAIPIIAQEWGLLRYHSQ